ncbi:hypothetical protein DRA42_01150 [Ethanoligenens harbinense]|nr:hypothetical protein CXQ68_01135 [Ethanoligenens harbinense YUAN-3]AYF37665.1 hypothetical protein CXP51_01140 [Ethanoligenens harbinense]AYF40385.1 hypothetical protein CN246_01135 [Ethanoligenens harbinense]QCN91220.1 hypothetical protein DRA42_01150 [Ethanoligenens harbinense]
MVFFIIQLPDSAVKGNRPEHCRIPKHFSILDKNRPHPALGIKRGSLGQNSGGRHRRKPYTAYPAARCITPPLTKKQTKTDWPVLFYHAVDQKNCHKLHLMTISAGVHCFCKKIGVK